MSKRDFLRGGSHSFCASGILWLKILALLKDCPMWQMAAHWLTRNWQLADQGQLATGNWLTRVRVGKGLGRHSLPRRRSDGRSCDVPTTPVVRRVTGDRCCCLAFIHATRQAPPPAKITSCLISKMYCMGLVIWNMNLTWSLIEITNLICTSLSITWNTPRIL